MFWTEFFIALVIAALLAAIFVPLLGWRRTGVAGGMGAAFLFFFLIVFLAALVAGLWLEPVGPTAWGASWLGILIVGVIVALVIAAVAPPPSRRARGRAPGDAGISGGTAAAVGAGIFFWTLMGILVLAAFAAYPDCGPDYDTTEETIM